jgi:hypothetical protein
MHFNKNVLRIAMLTLCLGASSLTSTVVNGEMAKQALNQHNEVPKSIQLDGKPLTSVAGVTDLRFNELFKMPVGPKGFELTSKAQSLAGKKVRLVGYMIKAEPPTPGMFVLSPVQEEMGDEDEKMVDDFPPNVIFVHLSDPKMTIPNIEGLIKLTGTLQIGSFNEADEHVSTFRLILDQAIEKDIKQALMSIQAGI